ncbi:hypothetical protein Tco_1023080 [Tanacetum coccineum]
MEITTTIDGRIKTITEASIRRHLKLEDADGISSLPNTEIFEQLALMGDEGSLTLNELMVLCTTLSKKVEDLQNDLKQTKLTCGTAYTKLILRVKKLEHKDAETKGRTSADTEILLNQEEPTKLVEDPEGVQKREKIKEKISLKDNEYVQKKTRKQLEQERLGHEEAIRLQEQINEEERQRIARDAEIAKQLQEEIAIARQKQEKYDLAQALELQKELDKRKEGMAKTTQAYDIDWSDPAVLRYHAQQNRSFSKAEVRKNMCMYLKNQGGYKQSHFRGMSYEDIRPIFERVRDQNQAFVPKDSEIENEVMKRPGFNL